MKLVFWGFVALALVRLVESILQWWNAEGTKSVVQGVWSIIRNFFLSIETYAKKK